MTALSPTSTSVNVVSGPIVAPVPTDVAPSSNVPGSSVTSGARSTELCTHVVAGSTTVTPARIQSRRIRRFNSAFIPASSRDHIGQVQLTLRVFGMNLAQAAAQGGGVEDIDPGVDLADPPFPGSG